MTLKFYRWYVHSIFSSENLTERKYKSTCVCALDAATKKTIYLLINVLHATARENLSSVLKIVNEYDQEIPQSQTADNPVAP